MATGDVSPATIQEHFVSSHSHPDPSDPAASSAAGSSAPRSSSSFSPSGASPVGATRVEGEGRGGRPWWLWLVLGVVVLALLIFGLTRCSTAATPAAAPAGQAGATPAAAATPDAGATTAAVATTDAAATSAAAASAAATSAAAAGSGAGSGVLTAAGAPLLPLSGSTDAAGSLAAQVGKAVTGSGMSVQSVPADEGFWVGSSATDRVWVQLVGAGESPYTVKVGDRIDLTGQMVAHDAGFAKQVGVDAADGAAQLTTQAAHIAVAQNALVLHAG